MKEYDWNSYKAGKEAFWNVLVDYNVKNFDDYAIGILHACLEWIEEMDVGDGVVRTLNDSGTGLTGRLM